MSAKKKKGLSVEEKRKIVLDIYHDRKEPFNLKEIETQASRLGVVQQTVKDINQSLVDDFLVFSDKIGSANFFWSFPSKSFQDQSTRKENLSQSILQHRSSMQEISNQIATAKNERNRQNREKDLALLKNMKDQEETLDMQLEHLKGNDPEEIRKVDKLSLVNKAAADRWTDNIWIIKSYLTKRKGMSGKEADKLLRIDDTFDYAEYQPSATSSSSSSKRKQT